MTESPMNISKQKLPSSSSITQCQGFLPALLASLSTCNSFQISQHHSVPVASPTSPNITQYLWFLPAFRVLLSTCGYSQDFPFCPLSKITQTQGLGLVSLPPASYSYITQMFLTKYLLDSTLVLSVGSYVFSFCPWTFLFSFLCPLHLSSHGPV